MCIAINRIIVDDSIYDPFVKGFVQSCRALPDGGAADAATAIGPIINRAQFDRIEGLVERAQAEGARLLLRRDDSSGKGGRHDRARPNPGLGA
jgi:acyl-CoA reductase-like NAD-dependent aldehyde dehydrogenase